MIFDNEFSFKSLFQPPSYFSSEVAKQSILDSDWFSIFSEYSHKNAEATGVMPSDEPILTYIATTLFNLTKNGGTWCYVHNSFRVKLLALI